MKRKRKRIPVDPAKTARLQLTDADRRPVDLVGPYPLEKVKELFPGAKWIDRAIAYRDGLEEALRSAQSDDSAGAS